MLWRRRSIILLQEQVQVADLVKDDRVVDNPRFVDLV